MSSRGCSTSKQLEELADAGEIDTVLCMFTDLQGRFMGKRVAPALLPRGGPGRGGAARLPLPARDRHGDGAAPRLRVRELGDGLRRLPDGPGHVDAAAGARGSRRPPWSSATSPTRTRASRSRSRLGRSSSGRSQRAADAGLHGQDGIGARVLPVQGLVRRGGGARATATSGRQLHLHHGLPHAADHQGRVDHPPDPQRHARRGHPGRVLEGRVRQGPARDQHHVLRRADERRLPRALQARREGDLRAERRRRHVHGEVDDGRGRLVVPHALERVERRRRRSR